MQNKEPLILNRNDAYIGVLIDDLVTKGTEEPYRMFTSRAEFRTLLRQDNADLRLTQIGYQVGSIDGDQYNVFQSKRDNINRLLGALNKISVSPEDLNPVLEAKSSSPLKQKVKLKMVLTRPNITLSDLKICPEYSKELNANDYSVEEIEQAEIQVKYGGYIRKEMDQVNRIESLENIKISEHTSYHNIPSLSAEAVEKLSRLQPKTLGEASQISGVSPSDISILMIHLGR